eukprot:209132-Amphidinium_carterae.1
MGEGKTACCGTRVLPSSRLSLPWPKPPPSPPPPPPPHGSTLDKAYRDALISRNSLPETASPWYS